MKRYTVDYDDPKKFLLYWIQRFLVHKIHRLSSRLVRDPEALMKSTVTARHTVFADEEQLFCFARRVRSLGLTGINTYAVPLEKLYRFVAQQNLSGVTEIDEALITDALAVITSKLAFSTKKNYRNAVSHFFAYIDRQNMRENPNGHFFNFDLGSWGGLRGKSGTRLPEYMREDEIRRFLRALESYPFREDLASRNRLLIKLILFTGMRVGEALGLRPRDLAVEDDIVMLQILGKGNKERVVMVKMEHIEFDYRQWVCGIGRKRRYLFCNRYGDPLTQAYISRMVSNVLEYAGIRKEKNGTHMLRHTYATLLYRKKRDLVLVQEVLGHESIETSRIYVHFDRERFKDVTGLMDHLIR